MRKKNENKTPWIQVHLLVLPEDYQKLEFIAANEPYNSKSRVVRELILAKFNEVKQKQEVTA